MSRMMTLKDLNARDGGGGGFEVNRSSRSDNKCLHCLETFFPNFKLRSFTFLLVLACLAVFTVTKVIDGTVMGNSSGDQQRWLCTLHIFQAKFTYDIQHGEVWRLITAAFLHNSFLHLFWNVFSILMIGFTVEQQMQSWQKYLILLAVGSYQGNVLSAIFKPYTIGVGASCTIFALMGALAVWYWLNYYRLGQNRHIFLAFFILIAVFSVMNLLAGANIDIFGHLGGFIAGAPLGVLFLKSELSDDERKLEKLRKPAFMFLVILLVSTTVIMFVKPLPGCDNGACLKICD